MHIFNFLTVRKTILLAIALFCFESLAFTLAGDTGFKGWANPKLSISINFSDCPMPETEIKEALIEAVELWNSVGSSAAKLELGDTSTVTTAVALASTTGEGIPQVLVTCDPSMSKNYKTTTSNIPAITILRYTGDEIYSALLSLNAVPTDAARIDNLDLTKLKIVLAHELGHVLGLGHSKDNTTLMYFNASAKSVLALSQDEVDGVSFLYPRIEFGQDKPMGCGTLSDSTNRTQPPGPATEYLGLLFCLLMIYRISRYRVKV